MIKVTILSAMAAAVAVIGSTNTACCQQSTEPASRNNAGNHMPINNGEAMIINIELIALDLTTCTRCVGSSENIEEAIKVVRPALHLTNKEIRLTETVVKTEKDALRHRLVSSPTIRINGKDIVSETLESECKSCSDLCDCEDGTMCRVWKYLGDEYTEAPVGLIAEAILQAATAVVTDGTTEQQYEAVPANLRQFFAAKNQQQTKTSATQCCSPAENESCCEPSEKDGCCDESSPGSCECQPAG